MTGTRGLVDGQTSAILSSFAVHRSQFNRCHTLRHPFATHLLEGDYDIQTVEEPLGHMHAKTTTIYTHVLNHGRAGVRSLVDVLSCHRRGLYADPCKTTP